MKKAREILKSVKKVGTKARQIKKGTIVRNPRLIATIFCLSYECQQKTKKKERNRSRFGFLIAARRVRRKIKRRKSQLFSESKKGARSGCFPKGRCASVHQDYPEEA